MFYQRYHVYTSVNYETFYVGHFIDSLLLNFFLSCFSDSWNCVSVFCFAIFTVAILSYRYMFPDLLRVHIFFAIFMDSFIFVFSLLLLAIFFV